MSSKSVPPSISLASFSCPHCGAHAQQSWWEFYANWRDGPPPKTPASAAEVLVKALQAHNVQQGITPAPEPSNSARVVISAAPSNPARDRVRQVGNLHASVCHACKGVAIWVGTRIVHPATKMGPAPNPDLPPDILHDYEEAQTILNLSPRGAAALLRLAIQKLCIHLGGKGKNIDSDIAALVKKGLAVRVQQALDIVRVVGNEAVHPGELNLRDDQDTALKLLDLVNLIADRMISEPKNVEALFGTLPASKRAAIEKRDKQP